ncbi:hypothetical protein KIL84_019756 [Mauremys mutica]|uniref:Uncharacterized protein n=1 Tax=Mauremys mutica TaxID=74926 RepID=A0A9D3XW98_9SAUR|nr:hypothetical protein KIL84_019756 [Mauremys mutica]
MQELGHALRGTGHWIGGVLFINGSLLPHHSPNVGSFSPSTQGMVVRWHRENNVDRYGKGKKISDKTHFSNIQLSSFELWQAISLLEHFSSAFLGLQRLH